jgi:hypothetical protein
VDRAPKKISIAARRDGRSKKVWPIIYPVSESTETNLDIGFGIDWSVRPEAFNTDM